MKKLQLLFTILIYILMIPTVKSSEGDDFCRGYSLDFKIQNNSIFFNMKNPRIVGELRYIDADSTLFVLSPQSFRGNETVGIGNFEMEFSKIMSCVLSQGRTFNPTNIVVDVSPLANICKAAEFYIEQNIGMEEIVSVQPHRSILDTEVNDTFIFMKKSRYFFEWKKIFENIGYSSTVHKDWLENIQYITGSEFLKYYGKSGLNKQNYCELNNADLDIIHQKYLNSYFPIVASKVRFKVEPKR